MIPGGTFELRAIDETCNTANAIRYSAPLTVLTSRVGDVVGSTQDPITLIWHPPDGVVDFNDISAVVDKFKNEPTAMRKARADVINATVELSKPDQKVDFVDISYCVDAFRNMAVPLPGPPLADPCE